MQPVDANDDLARAEAPGLHRRGHLLARHGFRVGRDRVFEIEDQRVGGKRLGLLERARVRARHVEDAAAGAGFGNHSMNFGIDRGTGAARVEPDLA